MRYRSRICGDHRSDDERNFDGKHALFASLGNEEAFATNNTTRHEFVFVKIGIICGFLRNVISFVTLLREYTFFYTTSTS